MAPVEHVHTLHRVARPVRRVANLALVGLFWLLAAPVVVAGPELPREALQAAQPGPAQADVALVATGLEDPWAIDFAPDGREFFTERPGRIRVIQGGALQATPWATLSVSAQANAEKGLLGLALDPDFATNHFVYVYYTYDAPGGGLLNRIVRMRDDGGQGVVDAVLLDGIPGGGVHDGGRLRFGPDRKLYAGTGEAGNPPLAQDLGSLGGKVLRLERDGSVPADNPFSGSYVVSHGHRNVQGLAWHPDSGVLYVTEHGPSGAPPFCCHDEINLIEPGANYGWPVVYGIVGDPRYRDPVHESGASTTWAPSGATFVTRGPLRGSLVFAALRGRHLHRVVFAPDGRHVAFEESLLQDRFGRLRDVVEGPDGALYVLTSNRDGRGAPAADDDKILRVTLS